VQAGCLNLASTFPRQKRRAVSLIDIPKGMSHGIVVAPEHAGIPFPRSALAQETIQLLRFSLVPGGRFGPQA
jgi:hypothetical protein